MERSKASVISARFFMCLAFADLVGAGKVWTMPAHCRKLTCDKVTFDACAFEKCVEPFIQTMANTDYQLICPWPSVRRGSIGEQVMLNFFKSVPMKTSTSWMALGNYAILMRCLEDVANITCCTHVSYRHHLMLDIHKVYFSKCTYMEDPGIPILLLLIVPCAIVPFVIPFLCQHFSLYEYRLPKNDE